MPKQMNCYCNWTVPFTEQTVWERYFKRHTPSPPSFSSSNHQYNWFMVWVSKATAIPIIQHHFYLFLFNGVEEKCHWELLSELFLVKFRFCFNSIFWSQVSTLIKDDSEPCFDTLVGHRRYLSPAGPLLDQSISAWQGRAACHMVNAEGWRPGKLLRETGLHDDTSYLSLAHTWQHIFDYKCKRL